MWSVSTFRSFHPPRALRVALLAAAVASACAGACPLAAQGHEDSAVRREELRRAVQRDVERDMAIVRRDLMKLRAMELTGATLRSLQRTDSLLASLDPASARVLVDVKRARAQVERSVGGEPAAAERLEKVAHRLAMLETRLARAHAEGERWSWKGGASAKHAPDADPEGYLGVSYSGVVRRRVRDGVLLLSHQGYPMVEAVEPGSPAARAGIAAGDTILAYDGRDLRAADLPLVALLTPGRRVTVKLRRAGSTKAVPVTVARRPMRVDERWTVIAPPRAPRAPRAPNDVVVPAPPAPPAAPGAPSMRAPMPPLPPAPPAFVYEGNARTNAVAGAEVVRMNDDLREVFGGRRGVLVIGVAEGSPAAQAGLRGGDVIVRAGRDSVTSPLALQRALRRASGARQLALEVVREKTARRVTLEW